MTVKAGDGTDEATAAITVALGNRNEAPTANAGEDQSSEANRWLVFAARTRGGYLSLEPLMHPITVVIFLERVQLSFEVLGAPKRHLVEIFAPDRPNQTFHEWV